MIEPRSEAFEDGSGEDLLLCVVCGKTALDLPSGEKMKVQILFIELYRA